MPTATTTKTPIRAFTITFSSSDKRAAHFFDTIKMMDFFHIEESPYDPAFVAKIRKAEKSKKHIVDVNSIWN